METVKGLAALILVGLISYWIFFYESPRAKQHRTSCEDRGGSLVRKPNAITVDILPYPLANFHIACEVRKK